MKKTLITLAAGLVAVGAFAQGTITFNSNTTQSPINIDGALAPAGGNTRVTLYYATDTGSAAPAIDFSLAGWTETLDGYPVTTAAPDVLAAAGRVLGGIETANSAAPGANVWAIVVGWTGPSVYNTFAEAYAAALLDPTVKIGLSGAAWIQGTGNPTSSPAGTPVALANGVNGFQGLNLVSVTPVPEPSTFALAGLGLASLLIFRRRK